MKRKLLIITMALLAASCSTAQIQMLDQAAGIGVMTNDVDQFDGARRLTISPAPLGKPEGSGGSGWAVDYNLGAQWLGTSPEHVMLIVQMPGKLKSIDSLGFNVGGDLTVYEVAGSTRFDLKSDARWIDPESIGYVSLSLDDFINIVETDDVQTRLYLSNGEYLDGDFGRLRGAGGALTARHYMRGIFLPEIYKTIY